MSGKPDNSNLVRTRFLLLALLLAYFAQGLAQVTAASITFDEGPHLAIGYATLRTGDFRLQPVHVHPPLANVLAAAPLLLQPDLPNPREIDGWEVSSLSAITDEIVWQYSHPRRLAVAGRLPILLLSVLLGALSYRWSADLGGSRAGLLALALCAFDPNLIAHGTLITTDMAAVFFSVAVLYAVRKRESEKARERESEKTRERKSEKTRRENLWLLAAGVLLGLAQLTKVSVLLLVPVVGLLLSVESYKLQVTSWRKSSTQLLQRALYVFVPAILVMWAGYGFEVGTVPGLPFPIPGATHIKIFLALREHYALGHPTFLLGRLSNHGWWWYFPVAFALKTPLPVLLLGMYAVLRGSYCVIRSHFTFDVSRFTFFVFPILYAATSLFSTVNIGYRHLLPILPFLYIGIASSKWQIADAPSKKLLDITPHVSRFTFYASRFTFYALLIWLMLGTLRIAPHYLTFFNELAGGPENGYRSLVDSNLDWGQNLWDLKQWMADNGYEHVRYAHYSPARPAAYGIHTDFLPPDPRAVAFTPWHPEPGLYAIGATVLQGPYAPDRNTYAWFRAREPAARLGNALCIYDVPEYERPQWLALCTNPAPLLPAELVQAKLAAPELRVITFDCTQSQIFSSQGPGGYVLPPDVSPPATAQETLTALQAGGEPSYIYYQLTHAPEPSHPLPHTTSGPLDFLGYELSAAEITPGAQLELHTWWKVKRAPDRPLSLMAHLSGADGVPIANGDGLGVPRDQWQPDDVLVQRHLLPIPPDTAPGDYTLRTGAYWLDSMERWSIVEDSTSAIIVAKVKVTDE